MVDYEQLGSFVMDEGPKHAGAPGSDLAVSICRSHEGDYNVILRGKIEDSLAIYAELIFLLGSVSENDKVNLFICSPGGSVFAGMEIANAIRASKAQVNTIIAGLAASIAAVIWFAGKERYTLPYSLLQVRLQKQSAFCPPAQQLSYR